MDLVLCDRSDHLNLSSKFVRIRMFITDFGSNTKVPAPASLFQGIHWLEGEVGEQDASSGAVACCSALFLSVCLDPVGHKSSRSAILRSDPKLAEVRGRTFTLRG